jgi:hypothetical protein
VPEQRASITCDDLEIVAFGDIQIGGGKQFFGRAEDERKRCTEFVADVRSAAMVSDTWFSRIRSREVRRLRTPVAVGSSGLSGKTSKIPRPRISSRFVMVALR